MKLLACLMAYGLAALTLNGQNLTLVVDFFSLDRKTPPTLTDLDGKEPVASQTFSVSPGLEQVVKTKVGRTTLGTRVTVTPKQEQYQVVLKLEWVEQGEAPPHHKTTIATQTRVTLKLNQPQLVVGTTESVQHQEASESVQCQKAVRVTLTP